MSTRRVLVIEDQPDSRDMLAELLRLWGYEVEAVGDGLLGVQKALSWQPHAAVVDIGLPLLDGYEVARQVRASLGDNILLVALTGYNQLDDRRRAYAAGFDYHIAKPAECDVLQRVLSR
jgi:CheY-like chemotaxis protein